MIKKIQQIHLIGILAFICIFLSVMSIGLNAHLFHFTGNNYCPPGVVEAGIMSILLYGGSYFHSGKDSRLTQTLSLFLLYFAVLAVVILSTNAAQYTPFSPIDHSIAKLEPVDIVPIISWTKQHSTIKDILAFIYNSLNTELFVIPLLLIICLKREYLYEYLILILVTTLLGFSFYYFYPTTAPASIFNTEYFASYQRATSIKFFEIHNRLPPSTIEGGMISFPSFHVIWAWLTLYALRPFRFLFFLLLPYNMLIAFSCIMLGWHYFLDIIGSMLVLFIAHGLCIMHGTAAKRCESRSEDHACIQ